jgi:molybdenum cofactor cytidylyltransferase
MIFGKVPLAQARGGILAHNSKTADRVLRKGALIDAVAFDLLRDAGYEEVTVARLEPGDLPEGEAATVLAEMLRGPGLRRSNEVHGRVNLFAERRGLLWLDVQKIGLFNRIDEAITLATLPNRSVVDKDDMVATLKIIPFAVGIRTMDAAEALVDKAADILAVKSFKSMSVGLILTKLPQLKDVAIAHTIAATRGRIDDHGGTMLPPLETPHEVTALTAAIRNLLDDADIILISGASAVTDRLDVAPQAIVAAGGSITHFGMPVDPGNLICFGSIGAKPVIVLPGCARSPKLNGIDFVLDRVFAGETVGADELAEMGVGGLLKEIESRPTPRDANTSPYFGAAPRAIPRIAALILAAGQSTRMGTVNKLLAPMPSGHTMIEQTVDHVIASGTAPVLVITGHQDAEIRNRLENKPVRFVHAADYTDGLAASLRAGVAALAGDIAGALICLGDMPLVSQVVLDRILAAYDPAEGRDIIIPTYNGQRGNPVLWGKRFFPELLALAGDAGARQIMHRHMEFIAEVAVDSEAVLQDFDTPEMLAALAK